MPANPPNRLPARPAQNRDQFREVLTRLANDSSFRAQATADPALITSNFRLSLKELQALRQVAVLSGADVSTVDRVRITSISETRPSLDSVDVSCCSCCCCCCGDTAVSITG